MSRVSCTRPPLVTTFLDDKYLLAGPDLESTSQNQLAFLLFDENESESELPGDFLTDDQAAHRRGHHRDGAERFCFLRQGGPKFFDHRHLLQSQRALKELAAVQTAAQNKVTLQEGTGITKNLQRFFLRHGGILGLIAKVQSLFCRGGGSRAGGRFFPASVVPDG